MEFFLRLAIALGGALVFLAFTIDLARAVDLSQTVTPAGEPVEFSRLATIYC